MRRLPVPPSGSTGCSRATKNTEDDLACSGSFGRDIWYSKKIQRPWGTFWNTSLTMDDIQSLGNKVTVLSLQQLYIWKISIILISSSSLSPSWMEYLPKHFVIKCHNSRVKATSHPHGVLAQRHQKQQQQQQTIL